MRNSLLHPIFSESQCSREQLCPNSAWRLLLLGGLFSVGMFVILLRVAVVQSELSESYLDALRATTVEEEILPARDGRILADSTVLAVDEEHFAVQVHYRWLETESNSTWLKLQIRQRLSREERRNEDLVRRTEQRILHEKETMIQTLCDLTETSVAELLETRAQIEQRVQKIIDNVNLRQSRETKAATSLSDDEDSAESEWQPDWILRWASSVRDALTTPPQRNDADRIIVREEEAWHTVLENVSQDTAALIGEHPERFPGVRIQTATRRSYQAPDVAVHLVGARTRAASDDSETMGVAEGRTGRFGVEKSYNHRISGVSGLQRTVRDRRQRIVSSEIVREPVGGRDVLLTIDLPLQLLAEQLLAEVLGDAERVLLKPATQATLENTETLTPPEPEHIPVGGSVVVMEADTGRLIALASAPDFDLSMFSHGTEAEWLAVNSDTRRPFVSRFQAMALPPGSTWKIVTALAGLQTQTITPQMPFDCQGFLKNPDEHRCLLFRLHGRGHGTVTLRTAMAQSCNVYFFDAAVRMGTAPLIQWSERLEFGQRTGVDLPFERSGTVPHPPGDPATISEAARRRFEREAPGLAIGQSRLTVAPLQMARLLAFVANGGWLVTPHAVSDEGFSRKVDEADDSPRGFLRRQIPGVSSETLNAIRDGLLAAVEDPMGTGFRTIRVPGVSLAGKTGTAESSPGKPDHAWFTGYFPAEQPKYVVVVALEHGGSGGRAAGPVARELVHSMHNRGLLDEPHVTHSGTHRNAP